MVRPGSGRGNDSCPNSTAWSHIGMSKLGRPLLGRLTTVGLRLHPGIIASVILVSVAAMAAAVLIIRKYCFPLNEAAYRYSSLRRMEDQGSAGTEEDGDRGPCTVGEESDEDLLE